MRRFPCRNIQNHSLLNSCDSLFFGYLDMSLYNLVLRFKKKLKKKLRPLITDLNQEHWQLDPRTEKRKIDFTIPKTA